MGDHYLPQYYLRGFSKDSGKTIWVYDKQNRKFATQVKGVANENRFYSKEMEKYLANSIEGPANAVLGKIRERGKLTKENKRSLTAYIVAMMKRVPRGKERVSELAPNVVGRLAQEIDEEFSIAAAEQPDRIEFIKRRRVKIQEILDRCSKEPPKQIWLDNIPPETTPRVVAAMSSMTWRFLTFEQRPAILTSDNPVFYFTGIGIGKPESEVTFPISSHIALWASWRADLPEGYFPTTTQVVKELNRRMAYNATRYLFHSEDEDWILPFFKKGRWKLHRFQ